MKLKHNEYGLIGIAAIIAICLLVVTIGYVVFASQKRGSTNSANDAVQTQEPLAAKSTQSQTEPSKEPVQQSTPQSTQSKPQSATPTLAPVEPKPTVPEAYIMYRITAADNQAQISPVKTTIKSEAGVDITIDLQCKVACSFKLGADNYTFSNTATYTSSKKITYHLGAKGKYVLYNQLQPLPRVATIIIAE